MPEIETYKHSGRIDAVTIPSGLLGGGGAAVLLAWVYQLVVDWIPFIYVSFVATLGFGAALGFACGRSLVWGRCRNTPVAVLACAVVALLGVGASHYAAYDLAIREAIKGEKITAAAAKRLFPIELYIKKRVENGWKVGRASSGAPLSGVAVYVIWGIEALMVLGCAVLVAMGTLDRPYCEDCQKWTEPEVVGQKRSVQAEALGQAIASGSIEQVVGVPAGTPDAPEWLEFTVHSCDECLQRHYLTIVHRWLASDSKGEVEEKSRPLLSQAVATQRHLDKLRASLKASPPPPPGPPGPGA